MNVADDAGCVRAEASVVEDRTDIIIDVRTIGLVVEVTTIERSANIRRPIVLDGGVHVPHGRQLQTVIRATKAGKVRLIGTRLPAVLLVEGRAPPALKSKHSCPPKTPVVAVMRPSNWQRG